MVSKIRKIAKHYFIINYATEGKKEKKTGKRERIFQRKVSYATRLLVLLQVTNYCILISMLREQEGGGEREQEGRKEEGNRGPSR